MQSHEKFKIFRGASVKGEFSELFAQVQAFANKANQSAKSIGVEYLETQKELIITLGFTDVVGQGNDVKLEVKKIGALSDSNEKLEASIQTAAHDLKNVICHALYINEKDEMSMIFMYDI